MNAKSISLAAGVSLAACAGGSGPETGFRIETAALTLDQATDACYTITVYNDAIANLPADTVVKLEHICGSQYGFETAISYVATCDAQGGNGAPDFKPNTVELVLEHICSGGACDDPIAPTNAVATSEFVNPCPANAPCQQDVVCRENADVAVSFDLTIMRDAEQGFFDVAVDFSDLFCSAKFDCRDDQDELISLLHDCDGERADFTAVLAVACTRGASAEAASTTLYMDSIVIACEDDFMVALDPTEGPGNALDPCVGVPGDPTGTVFQHGIYHGRESLQCDHDHDVGTAPVSCDKVYLNNAIGFDAAALAGHGECEIRTVITAADGRLEGGNTDPAKTYPVLQLNLPLTASTGAITCDQHPVGSDGFSFEYTNTPHHRGEFESFRYEFTGDDDGKLVTSAAPLAAKQVLDLTRLQAGEAREFEVDGAVGVRVNGKIKSPPPKLKYWPLVRGVEPLDDPPAGVSYRPSEALVSEIAALYPAQLAPMVGFYTCPLDFVPTNDAEFGSVCTQVGQWKAVYALDCFKVQDCIEFAANNVMAIPVTATHVTVAIGEPTNQKLASAQQLDAINDAIFGTPPDGPVTVLPQEMGAFFNCAAHSPCCPDDQGGCVVWCPGRKFTQEACCGSNAYTQEMMMHDILTLFGF